MTDLRMRYLILAHQLPDQLVRLVRRLAGPGSSFLIHWDRRSPTTELDWALGQLNGEADVRAVPRIACDWGTFSIVEATLEGIRAACADDESFDRLVLLSGQDYPIKPAPAIRSFFEASGDRSYIVHLPFPIEGWEDGGWDRFRRWHYPPDRVSRLRELIANALATPRRLPAGLRPFGGSQFWAITSDVARYVDEFSRQHPDVPRFFRRVHVPDEMYFQTILAQSPLASELNNEGLHVIPWQRHGKVLVTSDVAALGEAGQLFARKFDQRIDPRVLDVIDRELLDR